AFIDFIKSLSELENKNKILSENPAYSFEAFKSHFNWCLTCTDYARKKLSDKDIYEALRSKFIKDSFGSAVPFFFSFIDNERKIGDDHVKNIKKLEKAVAQLKTSSACPAISVIVPMYNAEKYIAECLDSLLAQTFQNFEVIVVDDCSTDNSFRIVNDYAPKFNGRLRLTKTEENSGGGGVPRNKGLSFSRGEYIQFLDADDMLTKTALEEMYNLAKKYDADVVYCEKYYEADESNINLKVNTFQKGNLVDNPTVETKNLKERVQRIIDQRYLTVPWNKLIKRELITENEIFFPNVKTSEDNIWTQGLIFYSEKFLRVPNIIYIYRQTKGSSQRAKRNPQQTINFWLNPVLLGLKSLDNMMNRHEFFLANPSCRYAVLKHFIDKRYDLTSISAQKLTAENIYSAIKDEFGDKLGAYDVLIPALCTALYDEKKSYSDKANSDSKTFREFIEYLTSKLTPQFFTARIDVKFESEKKGDFQIVSVSDNKAEVNKPLWFNKNGIGYTIQSNVGKLELVAKATSKGRLGFNLKGISVYNAKDKTKRIPLWVGYTKFVVNGKSIFDTLIPVWHDKPYFYKTDVNADEEITVNVEWLPRRSDIELYDEKNFIDVNAEIIRKFSEYFTARVDVKLTSNDKGDFEIVSVSDEKAEVRKAGWLKRNEIGYFVQSYVGKMEIVAKPTADGQINSDLRGLDIRDPSNRSKKIPYWVDYTKLVVNGEIVLNELTPVWHNKPFRYNLDAKADEEITINVEWQPHRDDSLNVSADVAKLQEQSSKKDALISDLRTALDDEKKTADKQKDLISELRIALDAEKKVHSEDVELIRSFSDYFTARIDVSMAKTTEQGEFKIVSVSDDKAKVKKAKWLKYNEVGYFIQSYSGKLDFIVKAAGDGQIQFILKGIDVRNPEDKSKRVPYWVDYTKFVVNENEIFDKTTPAWHDKPFRYTLNVKADEEIKIEVEWLPHRSDI
ncbi:MAG: glycosyltransferase, partial [Selenomonadaceae bacterium]|nr:glycosyltransferase [Selenomonadaceae bacterium]